MATSLHLSSKERFLAALNGRPVDRPPAAAIVSVATFGLMEQVGVGLTQANTEPEPMAALAAAGHEVMGFDSVMPIFSIAQEATALGCEVEWDAAGRLPVPTHGPWVDEDAPILLPDGFPDSFLADPYVRCGIEAIRLLKAHFGDRVMILGKVMGPWTLSYHVYGMQEFLQDTLLNPDRVRRSLETLAPVPLLYAQAQLEAGADAIVWADHATGNVVRSTMYRDFLLPLHRQLVPSVPAPVILHCCGKTLDRADFFCQAGFAAYHFESANPPAAMVAQVGGRMKLAGNINNPVTLYARGPAEVRLETQAAIDAGVEIIAPECAVPLQTPLANLQAIVETCAAQGH